MKPAQRLASALAYLESLETDAFFARRGCVWFGNPNELTGNKRICDDPDAAALADALNDMVAPSRAAQISAAKAELAEARAACLEASEVAAGLVSGC